MRNRSGENGQVIVLVLMSMGLLLGVLALAIDVGVLFRAKRNVQIAADAAAFAGALDYYYNASNATAISRGTASGVANGVTTSQITVNSPPTYGPNAGKAGFVEAIVIQPNNTLFMGYLSGISSINVTARAVAGAPGASQACIYISNPTASSALDLQGAYDIEAPGCGVYVNSNSGSAVHVTGNGCAAKRPLWRSLWAEPGHGLHWSQYGFGSHGQDNDRYTCVQRHHLLQQYQCHSIRWVSPAWGSDLCI
jgi:hypothetical protein